MRRVIVQFKAFCDETWLLPMSKISVFGTKPFHSVENGGFWVKIILMVGQSPFMANIRQQKSLHQYGRRPAHPSAMTRGGYRPPRTPHCRREYTVGVALLHTNQIGAGMFGFKQSGKVSSS